MSDLLNWIEGLQQIHSALPHIARFSLVTLALLVALVPFSFICWIISASMSSQYNKLINSLERFFSVFKNLSEKYDQVRTELISSFYSKYNVVVNLDNPDYKPLEHPAHDVLHDFSKIVKDGERLATDRQGKKTELTTNLNNNVEKLANISTSVSVQNIPAMLLEPTVEKEKREAHKKLILFGTLLVALIAVNTFLLNEFFSELFEDADPIEVFNKRIEISYLLALFFTAIEAGIGMIFGQFSDTNKIEMQRLLKTFCWIIIGFLALIETILYFKVGLAMFSNWDLNKFQETIGGDGLFVYILFYFLDGGWLSLFGPSIVLGLFICGHMFSINLFKYFKQTDVERYKKDLDNLSTQQKKMLDDADIHSSSIKKLLDKIREEKLSLEASQDDYLNEIKNIPDNLDEKINEIKEVTSQAENIELPKPEIEVVHLPKIESEAFQKKNIIYLILLVASFFILKTIMPEKYGALDYLLAITFLSFSCYCGTLIASKVKIFQTADNGALAKLVLQPISDKAAFGWVAIIILLVSALYHVLEPNWAAASRSNSNEDLVLGLLCITIGVAVGKNILHAINSWILIIQASLAFLTSILFILIATIIKIIEQFIKLCFGIIETFAGTAKLIFGEK